MGLPVGEEKFAVIFDPLDTMTEYARRTDRWTDKRTEIQYQYRATKCWRVISQQALKL